MFLNSMHIVVLFVYTYMSLWRVEEWDTVNAKSLTTKKKQQQKNWEKKIYIQDNDIQIRLQPEFAH